jgi:hypothetical protein
VPSPQVMSIDGHLELDNSVRVRVEHLAEWAGDHDLTKLIPYINGRAIRGNYPEDIQAEHSQVHFHLEITPENKEVWTDLLGEPSGAYRNVTFSVGLENAAPFDTVYHAERRIPLTVISPVYGVVSLLLVLFNLILFFWLAKHTNIIREPGPCPNGKLRPYSLGRTQMAFWFFLIYLSYLVIWLITGALDTITASLLGLMGISAGTALGEAMIDAGKDDALTGKVQDLTAQRQQLEQTIPSLQAQISGLSDNSDADTRDALNRQLQDARQQLATVNQQSQATTPQTASTASFGFIKDILSDSNGYSFHRFQIFAWTIVLGIMFLSSVYNNLMMPEFSATLLGLMGLSSGTYIGFKFPEQK